jgi:RIC1
MQVHTASCLLVVVDSVEGADTAHAQALALVTAALDAFLCDLCAELLRFLYPACDLEMEALHPNGAPQSAFCSWSLLAACAQALQLWQYISDVFAPQRNKRQRSHAAMQMHCCPLAAYPCSQAYRAHSRHSLVLP